MSVPEEVREPVFTRIREIKVKGRVIGGIRPNICVPMVAADINNLLAEAAAVAETRPDLVEWRADYFHEAEDIPGVRAALQRLREIVPDIPLLFTCRDLGEGGYRKISGEARLALVHGIIRTGLVDMVDIELATGREIISRVVAEAHKNGVHVLVSSHEFSGTPEKEEIVNRLVRAQEYGADIAKVAVMPNSPRDVLILLDAVLAFRQNYAQIPAAAIAMSGLGVVSRIAGFLFGSAITFASGQEASAPGQIPLAVLRAAVDLLVEAKENELIAL